MAPSESVELSAHSREFRAQETSQFQNTRLNARDADFFQQLKRGFHAVQRGKGQHPRFIFFGA